MWAVLPLKSLTGAKQRLASVLRPDERRGLVWAMVEDVLMALAQVPTLEGIAVVSPERLAASLARRYGARLIAEDESRGHTAAVATAAHLLAAEGSDGLITVPGDVPLVTSVEIGQVLANHGVAPAMTIVPSRDERGSNCIACSPPNAVPFHFGDDSFRPHLSAARRLGIEPRVCFLPGLGLDIDTPADLEVLLEHPGQSRSHTYLNESGIVARLCKRGDDTA